MISPIAIDLASVTQKRPPLGPELQIALNPIPAQTWYAIPSGALTFVNERAADYLGLPKDHPLRFGTVTGADWDSNIPLLHPDDREETRRIWSDCLRTGCAGEVSFRVRNAEGGYRWFLSRAEPVRAADGTLLYWIGLISTLANAYSRSSTSRKDSGLPIQAAGHLSLPGSSIGLRSCFKIHGLDPRGKAPTKESIWAWCIRKIGHSLSNKFKRSWRPIEHSTSRSESCGLMDRFEASVGWAFLPFSGGLCKDSWAQGWMSLSRND